MAKEEEIRLREVGVINQLEHPSVAKLALAVLYWAEGGKNRKGALLFGSSDPKMIKMFLRQLRVCYKINEEKFRITLQCWADQNIEKLEKFWSEVTEVPLKFFFKARIDRRSEGIATKKLDYKGVCRVDYYSADIYRELIVMVGMLQKYGMGL